jgi:hypothetical protein
VDRKQVYQILVNIPLGATWVTDSISVGEDTISSVWITGNNTCVFRLRDDRGNLFPGGSKLNSTGVVDGTILFDSTTMQGVHFDVELPISGPSYNLYLDAASLAALPAGFI